MTLDGRPILTLSPGGPTLYDVLTAEEACAWLKVSRRQLERENLPVVYLGKRSPRYVVKQVLDELDRRAIKPGDPRRN